MNSVNTPQTNLNPYTPNFEMPNPPVTPPTTPKKGRAYTVTESIFAWLSLIFGYLFCRVFPINDSPFGGLLFTLLLFIVAFIVAKVMGKKITPKPLLIAMSAIIISASLIFTSSGFIHFFSYSYSLVVFCYFIYSVNGNSIKGGLSDLILADFIKALFIMPFCSFGCMFKAMFTGKAKGSGKVFLKILIGVAIAVIPTLIVFGLLSYDNDFIELLNNIFDFNFEDIWSHIGSIILGVPIGLYIYGLFISSVDNKCKNVLCEESSAKVIKNIKIAPVATIIAAVLPLLFLYIVFFISQWKYYVSGFTGVLPENFSYAVYAREGFFQLCTVSVINLAVITAVMLFLKRGKKSNDIILKTTVVVFSLATLVLISTAVAKMIMYIDTYGLTQKRIYATWLMILIALIFILISLKQFLRKIKAVAISFIVCVSMFALLALPNVDAIIAKYNVGRYMNGSLDTVDIEAMQELGSSAIPSITELNEYLKEKDRTTQEGALYYDVMCWLNSVADDIEEKDKDIFAFTIPDAMAEKALKDIGYL